MNNENTVNISFTQTQQFYLIDFHKRLHNSNKKSHLIIRLLAKLILCKEIKIKELHKVTEFLMDANLTERNSILSDIILTLYLSLCEANETGKKIIFGCCKNKSI